MFSVYNSFCINTRITIVFVLTHAKIAINTIPTINPKTIELNITDIIPAMNPHNNNFIIKINLIN